MFNYQDNVYARRGLEGRSHILALPFWVAIIRAFQLGLALLVMILTAYAASVFGEGFFEGYGMAWFTFAWTVIFLLYIFVAPLYFPQFYLYWAQLGIEIVTVIFWLSTFALLAEESAAWNDVEGVVDAANSIDGQFGVNEVFPNFNSAINATKAATGLAALNWLLFVATLILFGLSVHKHRVADGPTGYGAFTNRTGDVESAEKPNAGPQQPVELREVQQGYAQNEFSAA